MKSLLPTQVVIDDKNPYPQHGRCANQRCHAKAKILISLTISETDFDNVPFCLRCTRIIQKEHNRVTRTRMTVKTEVYDIGGVNHDRTD